jgi:hypothetical protein
MADESEGRTGSSYYVSAVDVTCAALFDSDPDDDSHHDCDEQGLHDRVDGSRRPPSPSVPGPQQRRAWWQAASHGI